jgi:hypothetical protein
MARAAYPAARAIVRGAMPDEPTTPDVRLPVQRLTGLQTSKIEDLMSYFAPDSVWDMSQGGLWVIEGRDAIRAFFRTSVHQSSTRGTPGGWSQYELSVNTS